VLAKLSKYFNSLPSQKNRRTFFLLPFEKLFHSISSCGEVRLQLIAQPCKYLPRECIDQHRFMCRGFSKYAINVFALFCKRTQFNLGPMLTLLLVITVSASTPGENLNSLCLDLVALELPHTTTKQPNQPHAFCRIRRNMPRI
jgi:hypothetical protein